ncbi:MAG: hypothetical protein HY050_05810 [Actinobacteria bacterium]|nr:hypothetical protein [Actinomycetota bacterium]
MNDSWDENDPHSEAINILQKRMRNFERLDSFPSGWSLWEKVNLSGDFQYPEYILITLILSHRVSSLDPLDKMQWACGFLYRGVPCAIALQKTGLRLFTSSQSVETIAQTQSHIPRSEQSRSESDLQAVLIAELNGALNFVEKRFIEKLFVESTTTDSIFLRNDYQSLREMYLYFREKSNEYSHGSKDAIMWEFRDNSGDRVSAKFEIAEILAPWFEQRERFRKKGYYEFAAVLAFFSLLEHILVLLMPLSREASALSLHEFLKKDFREKWDLIFTGEDVENLGMRQEVFQIAEKYRNLFSHGGVAKGGRSLYVSIRGIGIITNPMFKRNGDPSLPFIEFLPENPTVDSKVFPFFDQLEQWLTKSSAKFGMKFIEEGLDIPHSRKFALDFMELSKDEEKFEDWLSLRSEMTERAMNFEL